MLNIKFNSKFQSKQFLCVLFKQDENMCQFNILHTCFNFIGIFSPCYNRTTSQTIPF